MNSNVESLFLGSKVGFLGTELLPIILVNCTLKKLLNKFGYSKKSVTNWSYKRWIDGVCLHGKSGGIRAILEPFTKIENRF